MVSVIIPNYNREQLITRAVMSVLSQTYADVEAIVVDDCSSDNSMEILKKIKDSRLRIFKLDKNSGACVARNRGINEAKGEYIAFLDSDDEWLPDKIEKQLKIMSDKKCDALFSQYYYHQLDKSDDIVSVRPVLEQTSDFLHRILVANCVAMDTLIAKREVFDTVKFDVELPRYQDWDIAIQIAQKFKLYFMEEATLNVYEQKNSITYATSKEKKYAAICYLYRKYHDTIVEFADAQSHFLWTMGLYSLCTTTPNVTYIQESIDLDKRNYMKKLVMLVIKCGGSSIIAKLYAKKH